MKKNWKKVLSLILALSMVLTMNTSVFATSLEGTDPAAAEAPAAETPAAEEPAQTPEAAPEATEPAPEAAAPAAEETEAPAAAEEPAKAEEAAEAAKEEAPAAAPTAETEQEDAAEGNELPGYVPSGTTLSSNITVYHEKQGTVVSDNAGNLKIGDKAIAGLTGTADKPITVEVGEGAEVFVGGVPQIMDSPTDIGMVKGVNYGTPLKNVKFTGKGTLYFGANTSDVSVNAANTVDVSYYPVAGNKGVVVSANKYEFYINDEALPAYYKTSFTGFEGSVKIYGLTKNDEVGEIAGRFAKSVSASGYSISVNKEIGTYKRCSGE